MGEGGIVDRQQLDDALAGFDGPVHQEFDVVELPHAEALFRTEGEYRHRHAGAAPRFRGEPGVQVCDNNLRILRRNLGEEMVGAFLPVLDGEGVRIYDDEFVFDGFPDIHGDEPPGEKIVLQQMDAVPVSQFIPAAHQCHGLPAADFGDGHLQAQVSARPRLRLRMAERRPVRTPEDDVAEGR